MASTAETLSRLVRRWRPTVLLAALGALVGLGYALFSQPVYAAKAYVAVVAQDPADSTAVSYAQAYARIGVQGATLAAAADASNGAASPGELQRSVRTSSSPDAPIIEVTGSAASPRHAADLANLVADGLVHTANDHSADTRMKLFVVSAATPPADPVSPSPVLDVAVGLAVGLLLGGLALLAGVGRTGADPGQVRPAVVDPSRSADGATRSSVQKWLRRAQVSAWARHAPHRSDRRQPATTTATATTADDRSRDDSIATRDGS
jgi:capsular polysaccharide biosynthesis protein